MPKTDEIQPLRVAIVGARRVRQGTGPYIARAFLAAGCEPCAVLGTTPASAAQAAAALSLEQRRKCRPYSHFSELLAIERPDIVALCNPPEHRLPLLEACADFGCHVYSEKPLWWEASMETASSNPERTADRARALFRRLQAKGARLEVNTQWPQTLDAFRILHPSWSGPAGLKDFEMWLSPGEPGEHMLLESLSHPLSLLYALAGDGTIEDIRIESQGRPVAHCSLQFRYVASHGAIAVKVRLDHHEQQPRPAGYALDGLRVDRHIDPGKYLISFATNVKTQPVEDPLFRKVSSFVAALRTGAAGDDQEIVSGMRQLHQLILATHAQSAET